MVEPYIKFLSGFVLPTFGVVFKGQEEPGTSEG